MLALYKHWEKPAAVNNHENVQATELTTKYVIQVKYNEIFLRNQLHAEALRQPCYSWFHMSVL